MSWVLCDSTTEFSQSPLSRKTAWWKDWTCWSARYFFPHCSMLSDAQNSVGTLTLDGSHLHRTQVEFRSLSYPWPMSILELQMVWVHMSALTCGCSEHDAILTYSVWSQQGWWQVLLIPWAPCHQHPEQSHCLLCQFLRLSDSPTVWTAPTSFEVFKDISNQWAFSVNLLSYMYQRKN